MKIRVVGHPEAVQGFALVGIQGEAAATAEEANAALDRALAFDDVGIVLVTERVVAMIQERINQLKYQSEIPLVVEIPGPKPQAEKQDTINELIQRAIGIKI